MKNLSQGQLDVKEESSVEDEGVASTDPEHLKALIAETKNKLDVAKEDSRKAQESLAHAKVDNVLHGLLMRAGCVKPQEAALILSDRSAFELNEKGMLVSKESGSTITPELLIGRLMSEIPQLFNNSRRPKKNNLQNNSQYEIWRSELEAIR